MSQLDAYLLVGLLLSVLLNIYFISSAAKNKAEIKSLTNNWQLKRLWIKERYENELEEKSMQELLDSLHNPNFPKPPSK